jgi:DNA-binding NarL/FixJ family response regulator
MGASDSELLPPTTVAICEDSPLDRDLVKAALKQSRELQLVAVYSDGEAAIAGLPTTRPRLLICDITLPGIGGTEVMRTYKRIVPDGDALAYTGHEDDEAIFQALEAGATGYILKGTSPTQLVDAIRSILGGGAPLTPAIARRLVKRLNAPGAKVVEEAPLTPREREILTHLVDGATHVNIAARLGISPHTVRDYMKSIYGKLDVSTRADLVREALRRGLA